MSENKPAGNEGCVLLVDDEEVVRESLGGFLKGRGFEILLADSVRNAKKVLEQGKEIEAIICDMKMPGESGLDVLRYLSEKKLRIPLLFLTGHGTLDTCQQAVRDGAFDYILKPVEKQDDLVFSVKRGIDKYRMEKQHDQAQADIMSMAEQHCDILDKLLSELETKDVVLEDLLKIVGKWKEPHAQD